jgi:hypothetical protein
MPHFHTAHDHEYWDNLGLDEEYYVLADILESNGLNQHQVLLDTKIDCFLHDDAGSTLSRARFPEDTSTNNSFQ